jgi:phosphoribosylformylglycinamidine synthase
MSETAASTSQSPVNTTWLARVHITLKPVVLDPQGSAVLGGLHTLGFAGVSGVRVGKYLEIMLDAPHETSAQEAVQHMCSQLLANPVIEQYQFEIEQISR